ncbi:hypothetical protein EDM57_04275 [Brevibacillus gelatini]|uniref:Uncharacterized protein n=1 Tax=Brevibacillus gelatini TaxID=1655277 RepID=A0A3M8B957_9BACL|nr:hypothetical protein [Brevibacillus gelatini]RNB59365.1 hypothetical protein EDM57_04275 [Brevibacillus gelatini]
MNFKLKNTAKSEIKGAMNKMYILLFSSMFLFWGFGIGISLGLMIGGQSSAFTGVFTCVICIAGMLATYRDWFKVIKQNKKKKKCIDEE